MANALAPQVINRLWNRLEATYGHDLIRQYSRKVRDPASGEDIEVGIDQTKHVWAETLSGFAGNLDAIAFAVNNLPDDRPPNVLQFRNLCRNAPQPVPKAPQLSHRLTAEDWERNRERIAEVGKSLPQTSMESRVSALKSDPSYIAKLMHTAKHGEGITMDKAKAILEFWNVPLDAAKE